MNKSSRCGRAATVALCLCQIGPAMGSARAADWTWQNPLSQGATLRGVWGSSGSDVFAVGDAGKTLHYDGSRWSAMGSGTTSDLGGVWGNSGSDVFAVGDYGTTLHFDGGSWSAMSSGSTAFLSAVWGSSASDVFAVGSAGTILHYDGSSWSAMSSGTAKGLTGVWGSSGSDVFAVGPDGTILHYSGNRFFASGFESGGLDGWSPPTPQGRDACRIGRNRC